MQRFLASALVILASAAAADPAQACRIWRPPPPVIAFPYQALVIGTATRLVAPRIAEVRIDRIIDGRSRRRRLRLDASLVNSCVPFYGLNAGDRLFLVLGEGPDGPVVASWLPLEVARQREPLVADYLETRGRERRRLVTLWRARRRAEATAP